MSITTKFVDFLNKSHSPYHAIKEVENQLKEAGFVRLRENSLWTLENNRYYYVVRNQSSLIAFKIPEMVNVKSINIVASHSDSPALKIKPIAEINNPNYGKFNVEVYGGALLSTWLDRPLSIAGRVTIKDNGALVNKLIDFNEFNAIIPNVAIHQNREANNGYKWNPQVDLLPITADKSQEDALKEMIASRLSIEKDDILAHDLYLYDYVPAALWGQEKEFISGQRIDNLESVFTSLEAFKLGYSRNAINMLAIFDNEEVGSTTKQGMASSFLSDTIERIYGSFFYNQTDIKAVLANSFLLSADNAHAVHPNHPELYDGVNQTFMNKGVVIKTSASQSYVTDSMSNAIVTTLANRAGVPTQLFANKSDVRGGSTQAAISTINLPIMAADVGLAQLAMHSCYETCGAKDVESMYKLMNELYNSTIIVEDDKLTINK